MDHIPSQYCAQRRHGERCCLRALRVTGMPIANVCTECWNEYRMSPPQILRSRGAWWRRSSLRRIYAFRLFVHTECWSEYRIFMIAIEARGGFKGGLVVAILSSAASPRRSPPPRCGPSELSCGGICCPSRAAGGSRSRSA